MKALTVCIANVISNVENHGDDLQKSLKIKRDKNLFLKLSRHMDITSQFRAGAGSILYKKNALLK